ncbi:MAG TPA: glycosyltransferase family 39 protein [Acidimicrobiales bacterium]
MAATFLPAEIAPTTTSRAIGALARWPLAMVMAVQALVSVALLHNTAFQDEALYLYAGRTIVGHWLGGPAPLDHYAKYFSGYPLIYPVIGGSLDRIGGLGLARLFSLGCMLGVTAIVYHVTARLFQRSAALFASATYAFSGVVLFVGRLATFDALCLLFIALGTLVAINGASSERPFLVLLLGPIFVLGVLTKYAGLLFAPPVLGLMVIYSWKTGGWKRVVARTLAAVFSLAVAMGVAYFAVDHAAFHAIKGSTTNRSISNPGNRLHLFTHGLGLVGPLYAMAIFGGIVLFSQRRLRFLGLGLLGTSLLTPAYHIYMSEPVSFEKHLAYGLFFAAPLAGVSLDWLSVDARHALQTRRPQWVAGIAVVAVIAALGLQQAHSLYGEWANTSGLGYSLHTQLRDGTGRILAEDIEVARFDARDVTQEWQWNSFYYPYYFDESHVEYFGRDALIKGVQTGYYDLVELSFVYFPQQAFFLAEKMAESRNYDLVAVVPFKNTYGRGHYFLWRTALVPGQGNFTDPAQAETPAWFKACAGPVCQPTSSGWPESHR